MQVLVADDDAVVRTVVKRLVESWGYVCVTAADGNEAWEKLHAPEPPEMAILDWEMPGMNGISIAAMLRSSSEPGSYIYVLLLTSRGVADVYEGLTSGADDYLTKPFNPQQLRARLHVGARILGLQQELLKAHEIAKHQAAHDHLTGLINRRLLMATAQQELDRSLRDQRPMAVILGDLDDFKLVNDTHGHVAGDILLVEVAKRIRSSVRKYDHVGRYGGEEFVIVAPGCDGAQALALADRVRISINENPIYLPRGSCLVSMSLGVAVAHPGASVDQLLSEADAGMYSAKRNGKNRARMGESSGEQQTQQEPEESVDQESGRRTTWESPKTIRQSLVL